MVWNLYFQVLCTDLYLVAKYLPPSSLSMQSMARAACRLLPRLSKLPPPPSLHQPKPPSLTSSSLFHSHCTLNLQRTSKPLATARSTSLPTYCVAGFGPELNSLPKEGIEDTLQGGFLTVPPWICLSPRRNRKIGEKKLRVWDFIKGLGLRQIQGGTVKKTTL